MINCRPPLCLNDPAAWACPSNIERGRRLHQPIQIHDASAMTTGNLTRPHQKQERKTNAITHMKQQPNPGEKLTLLGFCGGAIPIVAEMANEILNCSTFDVVKNIEVKTPERPYEWPAFTFFNYSSDKYGFKPAETKVFFGVLDAHIKYVLFHYFNKHHGVEKNNYVNLVHPSSYYARSSVNEQGFLLEPLCVVSSFCKIGFGVSIRRSCSIGHHAEIQDYVSVNPGVSISGNVRIGEGATIGTGATITNNVSIGKRSLVGAGSVVTKDIPDGVIAYGNPCRVVRENERWTKAMERLRTMLASPSDQQPR